MSPATGSPRDAARVLFNLPGQPRRRGGRPADGRRRIVVEAVAEEDGCPDCGVLSGWVHQRTRQRLRDVPLPGHKQSRAEIVLVKRRFACTEPTRPRRTFTQVTDEVPLRARVTTSCVTSSWTPSWTVAARCRRSPPSTIWAGGL